MAEEHRCEAPEGHRLCVNNCGFFGSSATMNLCSKCYNDFHLKEQHHASSKSSIETALFSAASPSSSSSSSSSLTESIPPSPPPALTLPEIAEEVLVPAIVSKEADVAVTVTVTATTSKPNRCLVCRKRVGLTGFKCRCGTTFCGTHRYPEKHDCTFDFKAVGREEIAKANPLVIAEKLRKI
uniref:AN1-type domain-containing protein n=1 Tax=Fagus sylvatica TaxID=28930 RepID=A0A2N9EDS3_FAGSY